MQTSVFTRYSSLYYTPDPIGDLLFNGVSQTAARSVLSTGEQTDASWQVNEQHTVRSGFQVLGERNVSQTRVARCVDAGADGRWHAPLSDTPFNIHEGTARPARCSGSTHRTSGA